MLLSILIVNYKTGEMTSECVARYKQVLAGCDHEIIVIDNHSQDDSVGIIRKNHPDVRVVECHTNLGYGGAVNQGAKAATGKYLLISNSDVFIRENPVDGLVRFYEENRAGILGIRLVRPDSSVQRSFGYFPTPLLVVFSEVGPFKYINHRHFNAYAAIKAEHPPTQRVDWVTGAFMFISRDNFVKLGGFDEAFFMYYEDVDLCKRASAMGLATCYVAEYAALHRHCATSASLPGGGYDVYKVEQRRSALIYLKKHHPQHVSKVAHVLRVVFLWTLTGLCFKYYGLSFSGNKKDKNRFKVNTYRKLLDLVRAGASGLGKMRGTISVIITCHNYGRFLRECIDSVLRQKRAANEIIVVDDASEDNSGDVVKAYADEAGPVRYLRNAAERGTAISKNLGLSNATGDYVMTLDADDFLDDRYTEMTAAILDEGGTRVGIVYTDAYCFGPRADVEGPGCWWRGEMDGDKYIWRFPGCEGRRQLVRRLKKGNVIHGAALFRRSIFVSGVKYRDTSVHEDWDFWKRVVKAGWMARHIDRPLLYYRQHSLDQRNIKAKPKKPEGES
jgi:hypothetical protein